MTEAVFEKRWETSEYRFSKLKMACTEFSSDKSFYIKSWNLIVLFHFENRQVFLPHPALVLLVPLALQPAVGFGLSNICPYLSPTLSPSSHSQHLKISFHFFSPSFPGSSSSSRPFQFLSEVLFGHPILLHSLQVTQPTYPLPLYPFYYIFSFIQLF